MFQSLEKMEPDALIALIAAVKQDERRQKIDMGVGVYQDESGNTPVMRAVKEAEAQLLDVERTKSYQSMAGDPVFNERIMQMVLGESVVNSIRTRACCIQTPGGSGALRIASEVILKASPQSSVWVSTPTWINHIPLIGGAGLMLKEYPYYDELRRQLDFGAMMDVLSQVPAGDVVLLHGCCHNPSGADLNREQWQAVTQLAQKNGFVPMIDIAYQGLGDGPDEDAYGIRLMAEQLPELIVTVSCSKNFGLYRERAGAVLFFSGNNGQIDRVAGQAMTSARRMYSMPPAHGAAVVSIILGDKRLNHLWQQELAEMRMRITTMRQLLVKLLADNGADMDFSFIERQKGMFSFLGLTPDQVKRLRHDSAIYMADSSRINVAGIRPGNVESLAAAICDLLT